MLDRLMQALGALLMLAVLLDIFLTVLYARAGAGVISGVAARLTWRGFLLASKPFGRRRGDLLTLCGPVILVVIVLVWSVLLTVGAALIIRPELGTAIRVSEGETPRGFITALYVAGSSIAVVSASEFTPRTGFWRLFYLVASLVGVAAVTLTVTYLVQLYTALQRRNALGLRVHLASAETGDAAELIAGLGPGGRFEGGYADLAQLAAAMTEVKESHHFYPLLFFFRFREPHYSVSRLTLVSLDAVSLIESALDEDRYGWLKRSTAAGQLRRAALLLVTTLADTYMGGGPSDADRRPDRATEARWRRRYAAALRRLRRAGIETVAGEAAGADAYVALRTKWDAQIAALAPAMAYRPEEIDVAGSAADAADARPPGRERLRPAG